jgi:RHS repeat-associated protein
MECSVSSISSFTLTYTYDLNGNRASLVYLCGTVVEYSHNAHNQVTSVTANSSPALATYAYDARNRLTSATTPGNTLTATYDCQNRPISRTINGVTTYFIWDSWSLIEERNAAGTLTTTSGSVYYHHDGLGSTVVLTDAAGAKIESYTYDVFGTVSIFDAAGFPQSSSTAGNRFLFTGREWITELGLYDYRNRVYSAEIGCFLQTDPIQFDAGDVNLYRYVKNSAADMIDPLGLQGDVIVVVANLIIQQLSVAKILKL